MKQDGLFSFLLREVWRLLAQGWRGPPWGETTRLYLAGQAEFQPLHHLCIKQWLEIGRKKGIRKDLSSKDSVKFAYITFS